MCLNMVDCVTHSRKGQLRYLTVHALFRGCLHGTSYTVNTESLYFYATIVGSSCDR